MEKDLWQMIDEANAQNYGNLATQLKQDMEKSVQATVGAVILVRTLRICIKRWISF